MSSSVSVARSRAEKGFDSLIWNAPFSVLLAVPLSCFLLLDETEDRCGLCDAGTVVGFEAFLLHSIWACSSSAYILDFTFSSLLKGTRLCSVATCLCSACIGFGVVALIHPPKS
ncbi:hypothetical protein YC2023_070277 [Brassica napus]